MFYKEVLSTAAIALTVAAFVPYIRAIIHGRMRPHVFSWVIWGITTVVIFLAQLEAKGGMGAWPTGVSGGLTTFTALLAWLKRADISITKTDWLFFIAALSSLPFWYFTSDPLWAVVILTTVDVLGFGPTLRKAWDSPHTESLLFYAVFAVRSAIAVPALEHYSVTTVLFPAALSVACLTVIVVIAVRRTSMNIRA